MPHGGCYLWTQSLILLHAISDGAIGLAYYAIPFILFYFVRQRKDVKFKWIFLCFAAFVLACGTTHLLEIWNIWHANYWLSGFVKAVTALVSVFTTVWLVKLMPQALALPSAEDLQKAHDQLEIRVRERTAESEQTTRNLQAEITARKEAELILRRTERALRTISNCNQMLVRANAEPALLQDICRVIVDQGGYRMACVGFPQNDAEKSAWIAAHAGFDAGYLEHMQVTWADSERGRGPMGTALRTGRIAVCNDTQTDPNFAPWRATATQHGFACLIGLPLQNAEKTFGVLTIYAAEPNAFNPMEIELLKELADDLAYGIQALRIRAEHELAVAELRASENRLQFLLTATPAIIYSLRPGGNFATTFVSPNVRELLGYEADAFNHDPMFWLANLHPDDASTAAARFAELPVTNAISREYRFRHRDGRYRWMHDEMRVVRDAHGQPVEFVGYWFDITETKLAESKMRESEARFHQLANNITDVFWIASPGAEHVYYVSPGYERIWGRTAESLYANPHQWAETILPEERERVFGIFASSADKPEVSVEYRIARPDGTIRWVHDRGFQVRDAGGKVVRLIGIASDITERKRAEQSLRESEALYQSLVMQLPIGIFRKDSEGRFVLVNPEFCRLKDMRAQDFLGKTPLEVTAGETLKRDASWRSIKYAAAGEDHHRQIMQTGEPIEVDEDYLLPNGEKLFVHVIKLPVLSSDGKIIGTQGIQFDITERKRSEEQLNLQSSALTAAANAIVITDRQAKIEWVNPAFTKSSGYTAAEVIGHDPRILKSGQHPPSFFATLWATILIGNVWHGEVVNQRKDGKLYTEDMVITPVRGTDGQIAHFVAIKQDVTERRQLENRLQQAQKMEAIGTLAGGIAHDFNNILAAIFGYGNLLQQDTEGNSAAQEDVAEILNAASRAKDLVQQILTFSRQREQKREVIRLDTTVREATKFLRASLPAQIKIQMELDAETAAVLADPTQIYQMTMNLATNALHAMEGRPGLLAIKLDPFLPDEKFIQAHPEFRPVPYARLTVADTGHGMDAKTKSRIFEPFFTTKPVGKGTGLGLAVVHGLVQAHEGAITVKSQPGQGTTFCLYFPAKTGETVPAEIAVANLPLGHGQKILVVDDEPALTATIQRLLERLNYQVTIRNGAHEALALFQDNPGNFDLVLTDLTMPEMNGLELARHLRTFRPDVPILLTSGFLADSSVEELHALGLSEPLEKPVSMAALAEALRRALPGAG
jgi:PAS domain S-box-containing protein